jgi:beta-N-acetylhexosaminidase
MGGGVVRRTPFIAMAACTMALVGTGVAAAQPTTAQMAGQRVMWPVDSTSVSPWMKAAIRRGEVGSIILFARNAPNRATLRRLTRQLQAIPRPADVDAPLLIAVDQEGGLVKRLPWAPPTMSAARMGARLGPAGIRAQGRSTGRALRAAGVNADLAPVCDLSMPGRDLARDGRAFGASLVGVGAECTAFAKGLADSRVAASAKHFPGFGRAKVNTDDAVVRVTASRSTLMREMKPFRAAVDGGVPMVMVSSIVFPQLSVRPALLSPMVVDDLLRDDLGFEGVTITDAIDTPALRPWGGTRAASASAAVAGMDLVIVATTEAEGRRAASGVARAMRTGRVSSAEARESLDRVLAMRRGLD